MKDSKLSTLNSQLSTPKVAFLWDESFLWGLMAHKLLKEIGLPFDLIRAEDIKAGALNTYKMLFVPGGWASNKIKALGEQGIMAVQKFVSEGGSYLGFCGGAGLATTGKDGLGLVNIKRRPTKERVPSFSGRIELHVKEHPVWHGTTETVSAQQSTVSLTPKPNPQHPVFHAWWPSQFIVQDSEINILATYGHALPDAFSSDVCVGDVSPESRWDELEAVYKINLNPIRLKDEPAVIEGTYGSGKVILSLVHFDTPDDVNGRNVLINLWKYLADASPCNDYKIVVKQVDLIRQPGVSSECNRGEDETMCSGLYSLCAELISLGERNFLWFWRNPMLLQWRRGVRGLEYNTLYIMMKDIAERKSRGGAEYTPAVDRLNKLLVPFVDKAKRLLLLERYAMQKDHITYERCDDPDIKKLRGELFSESKSHGGKFKELVDEIDRLLFLMLTYQAKAVVEKPSSV